MSKAEESLHALNNKMAELRQETQRKIDAAVEEFKKQLEGTPDLAFTPPTLTLNAAKL